ncbi:MAG: hypothetical protein AAF231_05640, partial [Pseudomonadota bacterium]
LKNSQWEERLAEARVKREAVLAAKAKTKDASTKPARQITTPQAPRVSAPQATSVKAPSVKTPPVAAPTAPTPTPSEPMTPRVPRRRKRGRGMLVAMAVLSGVAIGALMALAVVLLVLE